MLNFERVGVAIGVAAAHPTIPAVGSRLGDATFEQLVAAGGGTTPHQPVHLTPSLYPMEDADGRADTFF